MSGIKSAGLVELTSSNLFFKHSSSDPSISNDTDIVEAIPTDETRDNKESLETHENSEILLGDCLIVGAQILIAIQLVSEEKLIKDYDVPALNAIGWQGRIFKLFVRNV